MKRADAVLLLVVAFWGVSFVIVKGALDDADAFTFLALRFTVAAIALAALERRALLDRSLWRPGGWLGLFLFLGFITQTWGLETTTPSRSAFLTSLFVVFVPIFGWVMFRKRPSASAFAGSALAIGGTYLLSGASFGGGLSFGDWLTIGCAATFSVHIVLTGHWSKGRPAGALVGVQLVVVALFSWAMVPWGPFRVVWSGDFLAAVATMGVIATALGLSIQTWAQTRTAAVRAALIIALEPVFATAWSIWVRHREPYDPRVLKGGALILAGVIVSEIFKPKDP